MIASVAPSLLTAQAPKTHPVTTTVEAPRLDGRLDERAWHEAALLGHFRQVEPHQGEAAVLQTTVRVVQHQRGLWFGIIALDPLGARGVRVADLRREFDPNTNDLVGIVIGPLGDRRNATAFEITPAGTQRDLQVLDGSVRNVDWDGAWEVRTMVHDSGWTAEVFIPWQTIRYDASGREWDLNVYRIARRTNEFSAWLPWPRNLNAYRLEFAGALQHLTPPPPARQLALRPYLLGRTERGVVSDDPAVAVGGEVTWSPTSETTLDLTINTDFAQTDVDRPVINLTRFSVFLPERRQFFLESGSLFAVGRTTGRFSVTPFFSRRIGLASDGTAIPLTAGARLVERGKATSVGALWVRQERSGASGPAHFAVGRLMQNIGSRGRIGALATTRLREDGGDAASTLSGDWFTRFGEQITFNGFLSASVEGPRSGLGGSLFLARQSDRIYTGFLAALATRDYNPGTGFVSRTNTLELSPAVIGDWRPAWRPRAIRQFRPGLLSYSYHDPTSLALQEGFVQSYMDAIWQNGATVRPYLERHVQRPTAAFSLLPGVTVAPGQYGYWRSGVSLLTNPGARIGAGAELSTGAFFDGRLRRAQLTGRLSPAPEAALSATWEVNWFDGVGREAASRTTHLLTPELRLAVSPRLSATAFYQYNSTTGLSALNTRVTWEFAPLSYLFVVYNGASGLGVTGQEIETIEGLVVKVNYRYQR